MTTRSDSPEVGVLAIVAVLVRPRLWRDALGAVRAMAARHWVRRPPHLPVPDPAYLRWRLQTAYGPAGMAPSRRQAARDIVSYLDFRRELRHDR